MEMNQVRDMLNEINGVKFVVSGDNFDKARDVANTLAAENERLVQLLEKARDEFKGLPHSLGYEFTHLGEIETKLLEYVDEPTVPSLEERMEVRKQILGTIDPQKLAETMNGVQVEVVEEDVGPAARSEVNYPTAVSLPRSEGALFKQLILNFNLSPELWNATLDDMAQLAVEEAFVIDESFAQEPTKAEVDALQQKLFHRMSTPDSMTWADFRLFLRAMGHKQFAFQLSAYE